MCLFVLRFKESAVQTGGRRPTQRQVEAGTTAARVLGHLALKETPQNSRRFKNDQTSNSSSSLVHVEGHRGEAAWSREEKFESQTQTEWCKKKLFKKPDDCRKTFCDWSNHRLESEFWCWWHWTSSELVKTMRLAKEPLGWCELH